MELPKDIQDLIDKMTDEELEEMDRDLDEKEQLLKKINDIKEPVERLKRLNELQWGKE